jgi:hypothetical protein
MKKNLLYGIIGIISIVMLFLWFRHIEPFTNPNSKMNTKCPTALINDGDKLLLYNPTLAKVPGVNPIQFNNLEDYTTYIEWQRVNNLHCPVLKLDKVDNTLDMYSIKSNESRSNTNSFGNGNGTSVLNHDLPNIGMGCKDNGVKRITENDMLDYYTSDLKALNQLPRKPYLQLNTPSESESKLFPSTISEAFTTDLIHSSDLTTI